MPLFNEPTHWPTTAREAIALQKTLTGAVVLKNTFERLETVAGVDVSYDLKTNTAKAVVVLMKMDALKPLQHVVAYAPVTFPYISGLLSFREIPVLLKALNMLKTKPDFLMVDGQGIAHPRRLGIAAHLGVLTDLPSLGVAKSRLTGLYDEPAHEKGSTSPLTDKNQRIGTVLRSKDGCAPLFISPGHRMDGKTALALVLKALRKHRLPEPTRIADKISKEKEQNRLNA